MKLSKTTMLAPTVGEYRMLNEKRRKAAWKLQLAKWELLEAERKLVRQQAVLTGAQVYKLRAQRKYLYTPEECARRLEIATLEREGKL